MIDDEKYPREKLTWLAKRLQQGRQGHGKADRAAVMRDFKLAFPDEDELTPGKLAGIYRRYGGDQQKFIERYTEAQAAEPVIPEREAKAVETDHSRIIGQALLEWNPAHASFASAYALAAKMVNARFGTTYHADDIEAVIRKVGGELEFLRSCGVGKRAARKAAERAKLPRLF